MEERREIRFFIKKYIYDNLKKKAESFDVPLASYIKLNIEKWQENNGRRKKDK